MTAKTKKILIAIAVAIVLAAAGVGFVAFKALKSPIIVRQTWIYVHDGESADSLMAQIHRGMEEGESDFWLTAGMDLAGFEERLLNNRLVGAYRLEPGMTCIDVIRCLYYRQQTPVRITFHNIRMKEDFAGRVAPKLATDSASIVKAMLDESFLRSAGLDQNNIISIFLPDTYEVYWNISPEALMKRMKEEYDRFWNTQRLDQARLLGLSPREIAVLASIAEEETLGREERGTVARLYWNRLQRGMLLQADPTVKYAVGDFAIKRVLREHLEKDSPYNTYLYPGLPPGPLRMVEKATIDTILCSRPHNYIYMCAKEDFSGRHNFAETYSQHQQNAARYHRALSDWLRRQSNR